MTEDPRKTALKEGLRQLDATQLHRLIDHLAAGKPVLLDRDEQRAVHTVGVVCAPVAIAVELPFFFEHYNETPTDELVFRHLIRRNLTYNTRGIEGEFYMSPNRHQDLLLAAYEVSEELS